MTLTAKEISRACEGVTIVVRPQANTNLCMVAAIKVATGLPVSNPQYVVSSDVSKAVKEEVRFLDKMGMGGNMARASRDRNFCNA